MATENGNQQQQWRCKNQLEFGNDFAQKLQAAFPELVDIQPVEYNPQQQINFNGVRYLLKGRHAATQLVQFEDGTLSASIDVSPSSPKEKQPNPEEVKKELAQMALGLFKLAESNKQTDTFKLSSVMPPEHGMYVVEKLLAEKGKDNQPQHRFNKVEYQGKTYEFRNGRIQEFNPAKASLFFKTPLQNGGADGQEASHNPGSSVQQ